jgi:outer membrane lipoprotein-sorting protein
VACLVAWACRLGGEPLTGEEREQFIQRFVRHQQETRTYRAQLKQTLRLRGLRDPVESDGDIYYAAPGLLAMIFRKPAGEFLIMNGDEIALKKTNKPTQRRSLQAVQRSDAAGWLLLRDMFRNGATNAVERYDTTLERTNGYVVVKLIPKQRAPRSGEPVSVENRLVHDTLEIERMRLQFENDTTITYEFLNPARNQPIDPDLFKLPAAAVDGGGRVRSKLP